MDISRIRLLFQCFLSMLYLAIMCEKVVDLDCNFDIDLCNWSQDENDDFDWTRHSGSTSTISTGPDSDHTSGSGYYIYIEANRKQNGANATIISRSQTRGKYCLSFWYSIYGRHIKALSIYLKSRTNGSVLVFERNIQADSAAWIQAKVNIESNDMFQLSIVGERGNGNQGDIAVDDIQMEPGWCSADCDFDSGLCGWTQIQNRDDFDWSVGNFLSMMYDTGPESDHTTGDGSYAYIETRKPIVYGEKATIQSPILNSGSYCFTFWYNIYGEDVNTLSVQFNNFSEESFRNTIFIQQNNTGTRDWIMFAKDLAVLDEFQLTFSAVVENGYNGYIAIDDVKICPGKCKHESSTVDCTFESGICSWTQDTNDNFDWELNRGSTYSSDTGPSFDHTFKTKDGHYLYIYAEYGHYDEKASLTSPLHSAGLYCLTFWYHMYGRNIGLLNVSINEKTNKRERLIFTTFGNQGDKWRTAVIEINATYTFQLSIVASQGNGHAGDIAIDDIHMCAGFCKKTDFTIDFYQPKESSVRGYMVNDLFSAGVHLRDTTAIVFQVKCREEAYILLQEVQASYETRALEVFIGNKKSTIKDEESETILAQSAKENVLSASAYRAFWLGWDNGTLCVGMGFLPYHEQFMKSNESMHSFNFIAIRNKANSDGYWKFHTDKFPPASTTVAPTSSATTQVSKSLTTVPASRMPVSTERIFSDKIDSGSGLAVKVSVPVVIMMTLIIGIIVLVVWRRKHSTVELSKCWQRKTRKVPATSAVANVGYTNHAPEQLEIHVCETDKLANVVYESPSDGTDNHVYNGIKMKTNDNYGRLQASRTKLVDSDYSHVNVTEFNNKNNALDPTYSHMNTTGTNAKLSAESSEVNTDSCYNTLNAGAMKKQTGILAEQENLQDPEYDHAVAGKRNEVLPEQDQYSHMNDVEQKSKRTDKHAQSTGHVYATRADDNYGETGDNNYFVLEKTGIDTQCTDHSDDECHNYFILETQTLKSQ